MFFQGLEEVGVVVIWFIKVVSEFVVHWKYHLLNPQMFFYIEAVLKILVLSRLFYEVFWSLELFSIGRQK